METPEKIYVHKSQYWGLMANEHNITKNSNEYTLTEAFINKACKYISLHQCEYIDFEDFKNYMKGE